MRSARVLALPAAVLVALMLAPPPAGAEGPAPGGTFFDDDAGPYEGAIEAIAATGITRGCDPAVPDLFCPDRSVTRGETAVLLTRALALPPSEGNRFIDDEGPFEGAIEAIAAAAVTAGCDPLHPDLFCPERAVTRGEMAVFLTRAFRLPPGEAGRFSDDEGPYEEAIEAMAAAGITRGCSGDRFCPSAPVTRGQAAVFLARALGVPDRVPPPRPVVRLAFTGDVLVHLPVAASAAAHGSLTGLAYDFRPMFRPVAPILGAAALAICHLEVPLSRDGADLSGYPSFNAPPELAAALAGAGYDGCSTASNHALDRREEGIDATLDALDAAGLGSTGTARTQAEAAPRLYPAGPLTVGHLSYTYGTNGIPLPAPWMVNVIERDAILGQARWARQLGADFVVVSLHWGNEYRAGVTEAQARLAAELLASPDVDLLVGHHAHVVQPVGMVGDEYVIYGLGNSLSNQFFRDDTQDGVIVLPEVVPRGERWVVRRVPFVPTWVDPDGHRIVAVAEALAGGGLTAGRRAELEASWRRTTGMLTSFGAAGVVAVPAGALSPALAIAGLE